MYNKKYILYFYIFQFLVLTQQLFSMNYRKVIGDVNVTIIDASGESVYFKDSKNKVSFVLHMSREQGEEIIDDCGIIDLWSTRVLVEFGKDLFHSFTSFIDNYLSRFGKIEDIVRFEGQEAYVVSIFIRGEIKPYEEENAHIGFFRYKILVNPNYKIILDRVFIENEDV